VTDLIDFVVSVEIVFGEVFPYCVEAFREFLRSSSLMIYREL
jgi:hypothetical protein